jgi:hypothetical protein
VKEFLSGADEPTPEHTMTSYAAAVEEATAARRAARRARIAAATGLDHTPAPVTEDTARTLIAATGHTHADIAVSDDSYGALIAVGHHDPLAFMAAVHAITDTRDDPFGLLCGNGLYCEIYNDGDLEFADMADWGTEDVWHAHVVVTEHGRWDGEPGTPDAADCLCIDHTWAMREVPAGTGGAVEVTLYRHGASGRADWRYADVSGPYRDDDTSKEDQP